MTFGKVLGGAGLGAVAGGLVAGIPGAVIGGGLGGLTSYTTEAQNKANKKALQASNQYDYWLWQQSNDYNSPVQQMQRLAKAKLNPNLVYSSGSVTGNTSGVANSNSVAPLTAQDYAKQSIGNYQSMLTAKQMEQNLANSKRENFNLLMQGNNMMNQQSILSNQITGTNLENQIREHNLEIARERHTFVNDGGMWSSVKGLGADVGGLIAKVVQSL